ncbi:MAG: hypothetical protein EAZ35_09435 [Sphingobacteriia bacterium]|nr:MAG: hypothetical protein EAZ35_09435 [Sphingobacteriia bacterium]
MRILALFHFLILLFVPTISWSQKNPSNSPNNLEASFLNPPLSARPKALWPWINGNVNLAQISYELKEAKEKGMGGFDIWDIGTSLDPNKIIPVGPPFLDKASLKAIAHTIKEADKLGLEIGLNFSSSWNAGGSWVKPEHGAMGLFRKDTIIEGPQLFSAILPFPPIPDQYDGRNTLNYKDQKTGLPLFYSEVALLAYSLHKDSVIGANEIINLGIKKQGENIVWQVPQGKWKLVRYICAPTGQTLMLPSTASNGLMLDHFSANAQRANMAYIFGRLIPATGNLKNSSLKYLNADSYEVNSAVWTPLLPLEFLKQNKYPLENFLPVLDGFIVKDKITSNLFMHDFSKTLSNLIIKNHYQLGKEICAQYGIGFVAEAGGPGKPVHNVPFEDLKALGSLTIPRGEFWNIKEDWQKLQIVKGIASASHIYNQKYVEAESFTSVALWQEGPDELKPIADRALCEGLNRFVYHTFPHTPPESGFPGWVYNFGTLINTTNGWWHKSTPFHQYLSRCSYLLQQGNFVGDIAYYYGDEAPNFVPPKYIDTSLGFGYDYDVVNTDAILHKMQVRNGRIYLPHGQYYQILVLPNSVNINAAVLKKLMQMVKMGATIVGPKPNHSYGLYQHPAKDKAVQKMADLLWGDWDGIATLEHKYGKGKIVYGKTLKNILFEKKVFPDVQTNIDSLDFIHRKTNQSDIYFIRNCKSQSALGTISFRIHQADPAIWIPETGKIIPVQHYQKSGDRITIPVSMNGYGSFFVVFTKSITAKPAYNQNLVYSVHGALDASTIQTTGAFKLNNPWMLTVQQWLPSPIRDTLQELVSMHLSKNATIQSYSGKSIYQTKFTLGSHQLKANTILLLDLGVVKEIAEVFVNGKNMGIVWHAPYQIDISSSAIEGENILKIEIVSTINNRLVGDAQQPEKSRTIKTNITKLPNAWTTAFASAPLQPAGLLGPVQLQFLNKATQ